MIDGQKVLFSGMQATGTLTLGNYLGALKNWLTLSDEYMCFYSVVDLHSITIRQDPAELRRRARNLLTLYIAAGLDPEKNCIYYQSHVSGHAELSWILKAPLVELCGGHAAADAVRYLIVVLAAGCVWPMTFGFFERYAK